jgi:type IV pilus assembly protein PilX
MDRPMSRRHHNPPQRQHGTVLFISLILLVVLTLIGVTAARLQTVEEQMARNDDNHQLALQSAEAALRQGEAGLNVYNDTNFYGNSNGTYLLTSYVGGAQPAPGDAGSWAAGTALSYTGPALNGVPLQQPAQYVIEELPQAPCPGQTISNVTMVGNISTCRFYRVTARATGGDNSANVTIQSIFRAQ